MMRKMIVVVLAGMLIAGGLVGCANANTGDAGQDPNADGNNQQGGSNQSANVNITMEEAVDIALKQHDGTVTEVELEHEHGTAVYELEVITKDAKYKVDIDPDSGKVINDRKGHDDPDDRAKAEEAKLSITEAIQIAEKEGNGKVTEIDLDRERGGLIYEAEVQASDGKEYDVEVDANTGDVIRKNEDK